MADRDVATITVDRSCLLRFKATVVARNAEYGELLTMKEIIERFMGRCCSDPSFFSIICREQHNFDEATR